MTTDRPDDRVDVIEAASVFIASRVQRMHPRELATAMHQAGLLVSPTDQDNAEVADLRKRLATLSDVPPIVAKARATTVAELLAEGDRLRAQVAAVRKIHERRTDGGDEWCVEESADWPCETIQKLDTAGGEQS